MYNSPIKSLALINYPGSYFKNFTDALEDIGFEIFWVCPVKSSAKYLLEKQQVSPHRVLDIQTKFERFTDNIDTCRKNLAEIETINLPKINDIILMDRNLRTCSEETSIRYIDCIRQELMRFLKDNKISIISSGRDSVLQLTTMLIAKKMGISFVIPNRMRIPPYEVFYCSNHLSSSIIKIRDSNYFDLEWAENILNDFRENKVKAGFHKVSNSSLFSIDYSFFKRQIISFKRHLRDMFVDYGNQYSRYTLLQILNKYLARKLNNFTYNYFLKKHNISEQKFCLFTLHTQPESSIDVVASPYSDQLKMVEYIIRYLPISHLLYVKPHPSDIDGRTFRFYKKLSNTPSVRIIKHTASTTELIKKADIIFTLTGTIGLEGALLRKNVIAFAQNFYNGFPTVRYCDSLFCLSKIIHEMLNNEINQSDEEIDKKIIFYLAWLKANSFSGEINRAYMGSDSYLTKEDLDSCKTAYQKLYELLVI
jgi:hypothetical protein